MAVVKDMALTPEAFLRDVGRALAGLDYRVNGQVVEAGTAEQGLEIAIEPLPPRQLSPLLSMARSKVTISFRGYDEAGQAAFLQQFDRAYQRGGG